MSLNANREAIFEWLAVLIPELSLYKRAVKTQTMPLPSVEIRPVRASEGPLDPRQFPKRAPLQQSDHRALSYSLGFLFAPDSADAEDQLHDTADTLSDSVRDDPTLGGRVLAVSHVHEWEFGEDAIEVEYPDGTVGRFVRWRIVLAEEV